MNKVGSIRFEIKLDLDNSESYEISLLDLMKQTDKNSKNTTKDEIEEMNNYAKQMEKKYGPVAVVKGKKIRVNDFLIQGTGYDADDPFIDDSGVEEAVVVAPDLMTQYGGFFINNETLKLCESSFEIERVEGEDDSTVSSKQHFQHKNNKLTKSQQLLSQAKRRLTITKKPILATSNHTLDKIINDVVSVKVKKDNNNKLENLDHQTKVNKKIDITESHNSIIKSPDKDHLSANNPQLINQTQVLKPVSLPPDLPDILKDKVMGLIEMSTKYKTDGSKLPNSFNILLMDIDMILNSKSYSKTLRSQILRYISLTIDMKYDSILRRIYKFKENKKKQIQNSLLKSLQESVNDAMPNSQATYDASIKAHQQRLEAQRVHNAAPLEGQVVNIDLTSSQESETKTKPTSSKITAPKRNFKWTTSAKELLFELVNEELESLKLGKNKISPEEHLTKFFNANVLTLWPQKWMTSVNLLKVSAPLIQEFKSCMASGKEFKFDMSVIKPKHAQKVKVAHNGPISKSKELKEANLNHNKQMEHKPKPLSVEINPIISKDIVLNPIKVLISPTKHPDSKGNLISTATIPDVYRPLKAYSDNHSISTDPIKSRPIENNQPKTHLMVNHIQPSPKNQKLSSPKVLNMHSSKVITPKQSPSQTFVTNVDKTSNTLKDTTKRQSMEIISGPPAKSVMQNHQEKSHNSQMRSRSNTEEKIPYLYNPMYSNHNSITHSSCSTGSTEQQHRISNQQNSTNNHFAHSTPFSHLMTNVSVDGLHNIPNRQSSLQSTIQSINTLLNPSIETRQNIPQHVPVNKSSMINNQHSLQQAQNLQRHYMSMQPDFDSPNKQLFHQHSNAAQAIDLIESPISLNAHQISPEMYYNFNTAHFNSQRRFQN